MSAPLGTAEASWAPFPDAGRPLKPVYCGTCVERHAGRRPGCLGFISVDSEPIKLFTLRRRGRKGLPRPLNPLLDTGRNETRGVYYWERGELIDSTGRKVEHAVVECQSCGARARVRLPSLWDAADGWPAVLVPPRGRPRGSLRI